MPGSQVSLLGEPGYRVIRMFLSFSTLVVSLEAIQVIDALGIGDAVLLLQTFQDSAGDLNVLGVALGSQAGGNQEAFAAVLAGILLQPVSKQGTDLCVVSADATCKVGIISCDSSGCWV